MREILFRGKRIDNGEWIEGFLTGTVDGWDKEHYFIQGFYQSLPIEVCQATIGQYTGLTDKNGVKIFEGDRCKDGIGGTGTIKFSDGGAYIIVYDKSIARGWSASVLAVTDGDVEVIGNIYDTEERHASE